MTGKNWMPIYIGDYLGDTQRLTTEQHGAYLLLMFDYWRSGPPPDDDVILQRITLLDRAAWKRHRPTLERFFEVKDGQWFHKRIERERIEASAKANKAAAKAKAAAEARWGSRSTQNGMPDAMLGALQEDCPPPPPPPIEETPKGVSPSDDEHAFTVKDFVESWNETAEQFGLPKISKLTEARRRAFNVRRREYPEIEHWQAAFRCLAANKWMHGDNPKGWRANPDFFLQASSFTKLVEGAYGKTE